MNVIGEIFRREPKKSINAIRRARADNADAPPIAAIFEYGASACV
jgi:hypothetical protein